VYATLHPTLSEGTPMSKGVFARLWIVHIPYHQREVTLWSRQALRSLAGFFLFSISSPENDDSLLSHLMEQLDEVICNVPVTKQLPTCEHSSRMACSASPANIKCQSRCEKLRTCCGKPCTAKCWECQGLSRIREVVTDTDTQVITRTRHVRHPCEKTL
jgi:hypothetical protein